MALDRLRAMIPGFAKRPLRAGWDAFDRSRRGLTLRRSISELRKQARGGRVDIRLLERIHRAWGNESFSADVTFLAEVSDRVLTSPGPFLDLGSGLSTLVAGVIAAERGTVVWSFEQDADWCTSLRSTLDSFDIGSVRLFATALIRAGEFPWYDLAGVELPKRFSHVFCDGPSVRRRDWPPEVSLNWRAGVVPVLEQLGIGFDDILLDDAQDDRCAQLCATWQRYGLVTRIVDSATGSYVVATRPFCAPEAAADSFP